MSTEPWPNAAFALSELRPRPDYDPDPRSIPLGGAGGMLGPRLTSDQLFDEDHHLDTDYPLLSRVVAYPLLPLIGASFAVKSADDIGPALRKVFLERLPGLRWVVKDDWAGPFSKYKIVHGSLPAPPHPLTKEAMSLEVFGSAKDGLVTLRTATYSNLMYPGYQVPFYM